jgi:hypothetical protein
VPRTKRRAIHPLPHTPSWQSTYLVKYKESLTCYFHLCPLLCKSLQVVRPKLYVDCDLRVFLSSPYWYLLKSRPAIMKLHITLRMLAPGSKEQIFRPYLILEHPVSRYYGDRRRNRRRCRLHFEQCSFRIQASALPLWLQEMRFLSWIV